MAPPPHCAPPAFAPAAPLRAAHRASACHAPAAASPRRRAPAAVVAAPPRSRPRPRPTQPPASGRGGAAAAAAAGAGGGDAFAAFARDVAQYPVLRASEERVLTEKVAYLRALGAARDALRAPGGGEPDDGAVAASLGLSRARFRAVLADCLGARDALVAANMRLVVKVARGVYRQHGVGGARGGSGARALRGGGGGAGLTLLDLVQEGALGLLRAAETFDPGRGVKFSTYAFRSVTQFCRRAARPPNLALHLPERLLSAAFAARRFRAAFFAAHARWPDDAELAACLPEGVALRSLLLAERHLRGALPLDSPLLGPAGDSHTTFGDMLPDDAARSPDAAVERALAGECVRDALRKVLKPRDARVIILKFGLGGEPPWTNKAIAKEIRVSDTRVSQIINASLEKLRTSQPELKKLM